ncbi:MAG TPA: hypothetical protein VK369_10000, partial [Segetibacter sp.]|nr:hypothetical protein [Segetibacter sp.]
MKNNRRDFITKGVSLAAAVSIGGITAGLAKQPALNANKSSLHVADLAKDAGMQASEAYFSGMNERKVALLKQMQVFGAVGGINTEMVSLKDAKPWDLNAVSTVKKAWSNVGLNFNVVEGPPSLGEKTKLGL